MDDHTSSPHQDPTTNSSAPPAGVSRRGLFAATAVAVPVGAAALQAAPALAEPGGDGSVAITDVPLEPVDARRVGGTVVRVLEDTPGTMVGVTWSAVDAGGAEVVIQVRGRDAGGAWTEWSLLETAVDPASGREVPGTEAAWLGEVTALEIRGEFDGSDATAAMTAHVLQTSSTGEDSSLNGDAQLSQEPSSLASVSASAAASPALIGAPSIIRRATWGADEGATRGTSSEDVLKAIVIHHTAGTNAYSKSQSAQIVRGMQAYHTGPLDWADLGYNVVIDKYGQIFEGRKGGLHRLIQGAHALSFNEGTVGISVMGDYTSATITTAAVAALADVAAWKLLSTFRTSVTEKDSFVVSSSNVKFPEGSTARLPRIFAHRDVNYTECPGDNIYKELDWIRDATQRRIQSGWTTHLDAYRAGGGSALGTVFQSAHDQGPYWATRLTKGLILSVGNGKGYAYATPFSKEWESEWGRPLGGVRSFADRTWQVFSRGVAVLDGDDGSFVTPRFSDVPPSQPFFLDISDLADAGIATGYTDGTFRPSAPVQRVAMIAFIYRALGSPAFTPPARSPFTDMTPRSMFYKEVTWAHAKGIASGRTDGSFWPTASVERGAVAAFLHRASGSPTVAWTNRFSDVPRSHSFATAISWLAKEGITIGYSDGTFRPDRTVPRDQMAAFIMRWVASL